MSLDGLFRAFCMLTPPAVSTPSLHTKEPSTEWQAQDFQEFVPQAFEGQLVCLHQHVAQHVAAAIPWRHYPTLRPFSTCDWRPATINAKLTIAG